VIIIVIISSTINVHLHHDVLRKILWRQQLQQQPYNCFDEDADQEEEEMKNIVTID
jgi:hypothetical protein